MNLLQKLLKYMYYIWTWIKSFIVSSKELVDDKISYEDIQKRREIYVNRYQNELDKKKEKDIQCAKERKFRLYEKMTKIQNSDENIKLYEIIEIDNELRGTVKFMNNQIDVRIHFDNTFKYRTISRSIATKLNIGNQDDIFGRAIDSIDGVNIYACDIQILGNNTFIFNNAAINEKELEDDIVILCNDDINYIKQCGYKIKSPLIQ